MPKHRRLEQFTISLTLLILLVLSACNTAAPQPSAASTEATSYEFSADPQAETLTFSEAAAGGLQTQTLPEGSRVLTPNVDISTENLTYKFVSPRKLVVRLEVKNITENLSFSQPFLFTLSPKPKNIVRANAPLVTDAQLGGDGILSPGETSKRFSFEVTFKKNKALSFLFDTRAAVTDATDTGNTACTDPVVIPDEVLVETLKISLGRFDDAPLTCAELAKLTELNIDYFDGPPSVISNVTDLTGLEQAFNLERLELGLATFRGNSKI